MIVNSLTFFKDKISSKSRSLGPLNLLTATNDCTVRVYDFESMREKERITFNDPINVASLSPDGNLLGVYGDCYQAEIYDRRSKSKITTLLGHEDYGFAFEWHPSQNIIATGN